MVAARAVAVTLFFFAFLVSLVAQSGRSWWTEAGAQLALEQRSLCGPVASPPGRKRQGLLALGEEEGLPPV